MKLPLDLSPAFRRALRMCTRWGVRVYFTRRSSRPFYAIRIKHATEAPQHCAFILWPRAIAWGDSCTDENAPGLLHELAHCLDPVNPSDCREVDGPLLAVEYALDRACKVARSAWMADFVIRDVSDFAISDALDSNVWKNCTMREKGRLLRVSRRQAVKAGLLRPNGQLTYQRRHLSA